MPFSSQQVTAAVAFGIGIGLREGVGKASEFFAGCVMLKYDI